MSDKASTKNCEDKRAANSGEAPYDGYERTMNPDRPGTLDDVLRERDRRLIDALGGEDAGWFWNVYLEYLRQREEME